MLSLITGVGAKGQVGEAVALALARRGDDVVLVSRDLAEVQSRADDLSQLGHRAHAYACDLADAAAVAALAQIVRSAHGDRLDNLVNLAGGFASSGPVADSDPAVLTRMWQINVMTAYLVTRAFLPLVAAARGVVVYFASEAVIEGARSSGVSGYAAAKSAVVALMRSVADEGRQTGVRANALALAAVRTASNEASMGRDKRYVEREEVASVVAFLCSAEAAAINGQVVKLQ